MGRLLILPCNISLKIFRGMHHYLSLLLITLHRHIYLPMMPGCFCLFLSSSEREAEHVIFFFL